MDRRGFLDALFSGAALAGASTLLRPTGSRAEDAAGFATRPRATLSRVAVMGDVSR